MDRWNTGIFIFDGVEVLDFAGPFEVFSRTRLIPGVESRRSHESAPYNVSYFDFATAPAIDLLVIRGAFGTRPLLEDVAVHDWIRATAKPARTASE